MGLIVGLDMGIASVGWCVVDPDEERIVGAGVRIFTKAENPKTGASLALPRRLARSARRRTGRRRKRMADLRELVTSSNILSAGELENAFTTRAGEPTPYELRVAGLDRRLDGREWTRVLTQLCKRRGYRSMKLSEHDDSEKGALTTSIAFNEALMAEKGYRTVGEMLLKDPRFEESKRNRSDYKGVVSRESVLDEIRTLFTAQRKHGNKCASTSIEEHYIEILSSQATLKEGEDLMATVGLCSIDRSNPRIPTACPTFERFRILDKLHNVRYTLEPGSPRIQLDSEQRIAIADTAFKRVTPLTLTNVRKICDLPESARFVGVRYDHKDLDSLDAEKKEKLPHPRRWHEMKKAISAVSEDAWEALSTDKDLLDQIAVVLTYYKHPESVERELAALGLDHLVVTALGDMRFSRNGHLSRETILAILPHMESGVSYSEACEAAGFSHSEGPSGERHDKLPPIPAEDVRNPVVLRALTQTRKVINAIIDTYGLMEELHIELARDVARAYGDRKKIEREQKDRRAANERIIEKLSELGISQPSGHDIVKYKLWSEQQCNCAYSGASIDPIRMLTEPGYVEVDHILPHRRSFDDSYMNKVLVTATENQRKREQTPYEYMGTNEVRWHEFEELVASMHLPRPKRERLLRKDFDAHAGEEFRERNLNDTRYISRYFKNFTEATLRFSGDKKRPVVCVNGRATAYLRKAWRLHKVRADGHLHHAMDAAVVAVTTPSMVQKVSRFFSVKPLRNAKGVYVDTETGEIVEAKHIPEPWEGFRDELENLLSARFSDDPLDDLSDTAISPKPILVSHMPSRHVRGEAHKETVRRVEGEDKTGRITTSKRVLLENLTLSALERMVGLEQDHALYLALRKQLEIHDGNGAKAFENPFYKPTRPGKTAPRVRGIRVYDDPASGGVNVRGGLADNGTMVRTDVFEKDRKYYLVPVYLADVAKGILPNRAIIGGKAEKDWREMTDEFRFAFSLFSNDLVRLVKRRKDKTTTLFGYFAKTNRANGTITLRAHDGAWEKSSIGVLQGIDSFDKLAVDVLGHTVSRVRQEKHLGFSSHSNRQ